ncbi:MAG TPA: NUDIX hydrolase [Novosphingobium sp.]|nr:NUDIX hydrolase [Novosphingobium sp.]
MPLQTHALPYRVRDGRIEVLLVTSRRKGKWILPKGKVEPGETPSQRAAIEAFEEAGIRGTVSAKPVLASSLADPSRAQIYPLLVLEELEQWPEMELRQRAWFPMSEARSRLRNDWLLRALAAFSMQLSADRRATGHDS